MDRYQELLDLVATFKADFDKFYLKQNKSAGVRLRKNMAALKRKAQEIRNEVQDIKVKLADSEEQQTPPPPTPAA
jgi:signal recognition particle subunit SEC65